MSVTVEEPKPIASKLGNFASSELVDILTVNAAALDAAIGRIIPAPSVKHVPVASFASSI
jgi:hypothetical protein